MNSRRRNRLNWGLGVGWLACMSLLISACGGAGPGTTSVPTTAAVPTTASPATTPPTTFTSSTTVPPDPNALLVYPATEEMPDTWVEVLFLPYGETEDTLGVSPGGENLLLGPDYGAQAADGSWWFLDAAKLRLAHFDGDGSYLGAVPVPEELLVNGIYFQYQLPRILDDGTLVATKLGDVATPILLMRDGVITGTTVPRGVGVRLDDGELLYGFDVATEGMVEIDIDARTTSDTEWFRTRAGSRFRLTRPDTGLRIELPDVPTPIDRSFMIEAGELGGPVFVSFEVATGEDGTIHVFMTGVPMVDESVQLAGYLAIGADGTMAAVEPMRDPFSPSDPGSPAHLGVRPTSSDPWLMFIDEDGVRIYGRP